MKIEEATIMDVAWGCTLIAGIIDTIAGHKLYAILWFMLTYLIYRGERMNAKS